MSGLQLMQSNMHSASIRQRKNVENVTNTALLMCSITEGKSETMKTIEKSMEWQTAAAHAIVGAVGLKVKDCNTKQDLTYNKKSFTNSCIAIV